MGGISEGKESVRERERELREFQPVHCGVLDIGPVSEPPVL